MIPCDWEVKSLKDLALLKAGKTATFDTLDPRYPCYGGNGIRAYISHYSHEGTFPIIGRQGELCGNVNLAVGKFYATEHAVVATSKKDVYPIWLYYQLNYLNLNQYATGCAQPGLSVDKLNTVDSAFPPIEEQKHIAQALSDVDTVISTTEKLIAKKKVLKQGAMQTLLSGKMRIQNGKWIKTTHFKQTELGPIPQEWEVKTFKSVATLVNGRAYAQSELLERGKYKVLRVGNFGTNGAWYYSNLELPEKMYCRKGDLLYCWSCTYGAYIWNGEKTIYHYHIWKIIDLKVDKRFLQYILNSDVDAQMNCSNGSTMSHITKVFLENRLFIFPVQIEEQTAIATVLSDMDSEIAALETKLAKYRQLKTGMMQQLLTGKIRLV